MSIAQNSDDVGKRIKFCSLESLLCLLFGEQIDQTTYQLVLKMLM